VLVIFADHKISGSATLR